MIYNCPHCNQSYKIGPEHNGKHVQCMKCEKYFIVEMKSIPSNQKTKFCPFCGEVILQAAIKCKHCGEFMPEKPVEKQKNKKIAKGCFVFFLLSIILGVLVLMIASANEFGDAALPAIIVFVVLVSIVFWFGIFANIGSIAKNTKRR